MKLRDLFNNPEKFKKQEDQHPNDRPRGPEIKPTMPQGTVRVDVSDVYDWYKLGQHISQLKGLGKHDFGKGPPSTIFSFGSEDEEHKYIKDLLKIGLKTTDIDPPSHKKIKGQEVDPNYNVEEGSAQANSVNHLVEHFRNFLKLCMEELNLTTLPKIEWVSGGKLHKERHSFGSFKNEPQVVYVEISNRHPIDIMRTLAHELVHYRQWLDGRMEPDSGDTGSDIENEAHAVTGVIMRKFDDAYPKAFELKPVLENFADGKNPGRKGLSRRVGIPKKATLGQLEKIARSSTGERRRMAQWQLNMRRGKKK